MITIETIVTQFRAEPYSASFILLFVKKLDEFRSKIKEASTEKERDTWRRWEWEFKRWFWSFLENAAALHTHIIHVSHEEIQGYDVALIIKSLKSLGVTIKET